MCLEAIWGLNVETLSCVGYDHNWVRGYEYSHGYEPLLPKGTILHATAYMDNTAGNRNVPDPRNWSGSGNRSISNMFIDLGHGVAMTDEQFAEEMAERRSLFPDADHILGCPLCLAVPPSKIDRARAALAEAQRALEEAEAEAEAGNQVSGGQ